MRLTEKAQDFLIAAVLRLIVLAQVAALGLILFLAWRFAVADIVGFYTHVPTLEWWHGVGFAFFLRAIRELLKGNLANPFFEHLFTSEEEEKAS